MAEVREITRIEFSLARLVINPSVTPSAKYSCVGSPDTFSNGSTSSDCIRGTSAVGRMNSAATDTTINTNASEIDTRTAGRVGSRTWIAATGIATAPVAWAMDALFRIDSGREPDPQSTGAMKR